jgi:urease accessory protein UreF
MDGNRLAEEAAYFAAVDAGYESAAEEINRLTAELTAAKEENTALRERVRRMGSALREMAKPCGDPGCGCCRQTSTMSEYALLDVSDTGVGETAQAALKEGE